LNPQALRRHKPLPIGGVEFCAKLLIDGVQLRVPPHLSLYRY
jgi:hypothetical protein